MIVQCEQCKTRFRLDPERIKEASARVRCSRCQHIFTVQRPQPPAAPEFIPGAKLVGRKAPRRASRLLIVLLLPLLLVGAAFALWRYLPPYLHQGRSAQQDSGIALLHLAQTRGYFVDNQKAGQLFVIEGRVRNDFPKPRRWIRLRARLYTADGRAARQLDFYAGNGLSARQLATAALPELLRLIQRRPSGGQASGIIPPGQEASFMVVFGNLPELSQLSDYSVEILSSQPA